VNIKILVISTIWAALAGGAIGYLVASNQCSEKVNTAKTALSSRPAMSIVTGEIVARAGNVITIRSQARTQATADIPMMREVTVTGSTILVKSMLKIPPMISDFAVGDVIEVDAGKDVATLSSFDAVKITFLGIAVSLPSSVQ